MSNARRAMTDVHATREREARRIAGKIRTLFDEVLEVHHGLGPLSVLIPGAERTREIASALAHVKSAADALCAAVDVLEPSGNQHTDSRGAR